MAGAVIQAIGGGLRIVAPRLFGGAATTAGRMAPTAGRAALNQIRHQSDAESEAESKPKTEADACANCRDPRCVELEKQMRHAIERRRGVDGVANRGLREQAENLVNPKTPLDQLERPGGGRGRKPGGHAKSWNETKNTLNNRAQDYEDAGCGKPPPDIQKWIDMEMPKPGDVIPP